MTKEKTGESPSKVMIVEDNIGSAKLFENWLQETYTVEVATDCATAYELLDETVDVALLDRHLPDGSGDELVTAISDQDLDCQVVMVTAVEPSDEIVAMEFDEYLCKPVRQDELLDTVEQVLAQAAYGGAVQDLYVLTMKKSLIETYCSEEELAMSEAYAVLEDRIDDLEADLTEITGTFTETQYKAEYARLGTESD